MAPHSSTLAWKIPWMEEPRRLQSMGSLRVGHDWATSLSLFTFMHWRKKWQPTPVFLPGESQGRGAWQAAVYGVAQSWTWLKWLSTLAIFILSNYDSFFFFPLFIPRLQRFSYLEMIDISIHIFFNSLILELIWCFVGFSVWSFLKIYLFLFQLRVLFFPPNFCQLSKHVSEK